MDAEREDKVAQFSAVTGANPSVAQTALNSSNWNLEEAVSLYFAANEEDPADIDDDVEEAPPSGPTPSQPQASSSSSRNPRGGASKKMKTIRDLQAGDDDDGDEDKKQDMFAGGEKSGLAVENPDRRGAPIDHFRNIMNQAQQNRDRPGAAEGEEEEDSDHPSHFTGRAQTLGGDDAPSRLVNDPSAAAGLPSRQPPPRVTRTLHLWADGVSIDDGPLLRFDDPANEHIMQEINQGRAPKALLDVQPDQEVDLNLEPHKGEKYVAPKPKYKPFGGSGQRLGSPTPGLASSSSAPTTSAAPAAAASAASSPSTQQMNVDDSQPTVQLQIRLGDGTRLSSRFNTSHTIGDVYEFVNRASPASQQRAYALMTTFPSKELDNKAEVLGDIGDFKRGGVLVQKWK